MILQKKRVSKKIRKSNAVRIFISLAVLTMAAAADTIHMPLLWSSNQNTLLESAPIVADINGDGRDEILVAGREEIIAIGKKGNELWRRRTRGRFMTYPAVLSRAGKSALIYAADNSGLLTCFDGGGQVVWQAELGGPAEWSASVIADLDGDGATEVVQTDGTGTVWAFDALTGVVRRQASVSGKPVSPAVGDLDGDSKKDIVVMSNDGVLSAIAGDGSNLWDFKVGGPSETWATSAPVIFAASDGTARVAAASSDGVIYCLDARGTALWSYPTRGPVASTISVGDFDLDGQADIFLITQTGVVYRFSETGALLWDIDMQGRSLASGSIIDIDNDGRLDYILCTQRGHLLAYDQNGGVIIDYQFGNRTINVTPAFGDVTRGAKDLEMVVTGGESGQVFCFGPPALTTTQKQWISYRRDVHNSGAWTEPAQSRLLRMIPQNLAWDQLLAGESIRFAVVNPGGNALKAAATCLRPDGARLSAASTVLGTQGQLLLPVAFAAPGVYHFRWTLSNQNGRRLLSKERDVSVQPFANDRAFVERAVESLLSSAEKVEDTLPLSANALRRRASELTAGTAELRPLQEAAPGSDAAGIQTTLEKTAGLVNQAKRARRISEVIDNAAALGEGASLLAFEGKKWENRNVDNQLPLRVENPLDIRYTVVPGEHQPVPLMLFNITDHLLNVRVEIESDDAVKVTPLHSVATPTSLGEESWDALPEMDESGLLSIPSLSSREVWLDIQIADSAVGNQKINVRLSALNGAGVLDAPKNAHAVPAPETQVGISIDVLPFDMAPSGGFRLCTWSPSKGAVVQDLLAHGNNVFIVPHADLKYENGALADINFNEFDDIVQQVQGHDVLLLINGLPAVQGEFGGDPYKKDLAEYLKRLIAHLAGLGIGADHFALYPFDEPGGHGWEYVDKLVEFGRMVHEVNPDIMLYVDGGGELPMFKAMATCIDVWTPPIEWLPEPMPEMNVMRTTGKMLWSYNCAYTTARPVGPNIKNINLIGEFRTAALFALRHGANGIGFWCYNAGRENPWGRITLEYNLVYPGRTKPVDSRRWEAVREGIEDYRILAALQRLSDSGNLDIAAKKKIDHLMNVSLPDLVDPGFRAMKLGLARDVLDDLYNEAKMDAFRREMLGCVKQASAEE